MEYTKNFTLKEKSHAELAVTVKDSEVNSKYDELLKKYSKELQLPGFRKGKVPVSILEQKYGDAIKSDLAGDLVENSLKEIFENMDEYERPLQYSYPELKEKPQLKTGEDFNFTVHYDVFPKFKINKTEGFEIEVPQVTISDDDIKKELEQIQERNALVSNCKEGAKVEKDHIATINYSELDEAGTEIEGTAREDFVFTVGTKKNFFELDDEIIGMQVGEKKEFSKEFPSNHQNSDLAGKTKKIKVELKELKFKDLPAIDDDLAQDVSEKYKTLDDLKADLKKNIQNSINAKLKKQKEKAVVEQILAETTIDLPESMIRAELETRWMITANQFKMNPKDLEKVFGGQNGQSKDSLLEGWREDSEKNLKNSLIVEILLKDSKIEVSDEEIETAYKEIAEANGMSTEELKKYYTDQSQTHYFAEGVKEDKLFKGIFEKSKISTGKKMTVTEFFEDKEA